uniref:Uncharacterized protein n=1 Tax=Rhizophora mucronata TaxID=61149 RepID=A0A2P2P2G5_RHIMU
MSASGYVGKIESLTVPTGGFVEKLNLFDCRYWFLSCEFWGFCVFLCFCWSVE